MVKGSSVDLASEYSLAFASYARARNEADRQMAYDLGRDAVRSQLNVLDLALVHHEALSSALKCATSDKDIQQLTSAGADFLSEVLSAYEMVRRGYEEVRETALMERQHADRLRQLADAFIEINSTH